MPPYLIPTDIIHRVTTHSVFVALFVVCFVSDGGTLALAESDSFESVLQSLFQHRCIKCHGQEGKVEGDVDLLSAHRVQDLSSRPKLIGELIRVIESGYMPPEDEVQLAFPLRQQLVSELKKMLAIAIESQPSASRTPIRRMNRFQYNNAVKDLFELSVEVYPLPERMMRDLGGYFQPQSETMPSEVKVTSRPLSKDKKTEPHLRGVTPFPQDLRAEHGFDNRGDHLTLSPMLLESFIRLSRSIVESPDFNKKTCGNWSDFFEEPLQREIGKLDVTVRDRLTKFLARAFRRPVEEEIVERYATRVLSQLAAGEAFVDAMKDVAAAAIASPRFFYSYDFKRSDTEESFDDFSLASRLSLFLWGSIPDEALFELAASGKLREPAILTQQVERMLRDKKIKRFCDTFPSQWLQLERIISSEPDPDLYPQFYFAKYRASMHMMLEPLLVFETVLIENQSVLQLIDADFSYRSDLLDAWYRDGSQGNAGAPNEVVLRRVPITDRRQGGVITNAAVLTMTSGTTRTKPITRGAWLASVILNDPPPPPPGDVKPLSDKPMDNEEHLTLRERFVAHRKEPACAGCHQRIDPLGFALENFDAAGIWRDRYENGRSIDATGTLFDQYAFQDVVGFKDALLAERDRFVRAFAGHLLSFAICREIGVEDSPALDRVVRENAAEDYHIHSLIRQVVLSDSFTK